MSEIVIEPELLEFRPPLVAESTDYISITNRSDQVIAFKVKTTAPKLYCVRPTAALVQPGEIAKIEIIFLGLTEEPVQGTKCKDKFLVLVLPAPYDLQGQAVPEVWASLEAEFKQDIISKKIKVRYDFENTAIEPASVVAPVPITKSIPRSPIPEEPEVVQGMRDEPTKTEINEKVKQQVVTAAPAAAPAPASVSAPIEKGLPRKEAVETSKKEEVKPATPVANYDVPLAKQEAAVPSTGNSNLLLLIAIIVFLLAWLYY